MAFFLGMGIGLIALWLLLARDADYPITNAAPTGSNIIAFGDSLTAGQGAGPNDAYPAVLSRRLDVPIVNAGISGDTTAGAMQRLEREVLSRDPRIVLLCLGGNDVLRKTKADDTFANLRGMIERIQRTGALVILIGIEFPLRDHGKRYRQLARETGCPYVPDLLGGILANPELMADAVHPNAAGYRKVADKIEPVLRKYLSSDTEN